MLHGRQRAPDLRDSAVSVSDKIEPSLAAVSVCRISGSGQAVQPDVLAVEEPLEIRLGGDVDGRRRPASTALAGCTPRRCSTPKATCSACERTSAGTTPWTS